MFIRCRIVCIILTGPASSHSRVGWSSWTQAVIAIIYRTAHTVYGNGRKWWCATYFTGNFWRYFRTLKTCISLMKGDDDSEIGDLMGISPITTMRRRTSYYGGYKRTEKGTPALLYHISRRRGVAGEKCDPAADNQKGMWRRLKGVLSSWKPLRGKSFTSGGITEWVLLSKRVFARFFKNTGMCPSSVLLTKYRRQRGADATDGVHSEFSDYSQ